MLIRVLGECLIEVGDRRITPSSPHLFALLLYLAAQPGRRFQREHLAQLLFPSAPTGVAGLHSLRQLAFTARKFGVAMGANSGTLSLGVDASRIDAEDDLDLIVSAGEFAFGRLKVLPDYSPSLSDSYSLWLDLFRQQTQAHIRRRLVQSIELHRQRANWHFVETLAKECLSFDPLNEVATLALAEALARTGSKQRAVAILDAYAMEVGEMDERIALPAKLLRRRVDCGPRLAVQHRHLTPLSGRGDDLKVLHDQWRRARSGRVECTLIRGQQGAGKSRLIDEFLTQISLEGNSSITVVRNCVAVPHRPLSLFSELLPNLMKQPGAAGCDPSLLPFLSLLGGCSAQDTQEQSSPGQTGFANYGVTRAVIDLLQALSVERSCLIAIDDSRAIDAASLELLQHLTTLPDPIRVHLVIVCESNDLRTGLLRLPAKTRFLSALTQEESRDLLASHLKQLGSSLPDEQLAWCISIAGGNPAFLFLVAEQSLQADRARDIPTDILSALDQRLTNLTVMARTVLEACCVLGSDCDSVILGSILDLSAFDLITALDDLERNGLLYYDDDRILLRSGLIHERGLRLAARCVLSVLHARCAAVLETRASSQDSAWRVAFHWREAGQHGKARTALTAAWRMSLRLGRPATLEVSIREHIANTRERIERVPLYDDLIEVTQASGRIRATVEAIDERTALLRVLGAPDRREEAVAFDRMDALLGDFANPALAEAELLTYMRSPSLDATRRLRSARRLMVSADATANESLATLVASEIEGVVLDQSSDRVCKEQALVIYHSVFGSPTEALRLARRIISEGNDNPFSWLHTQALINACLALQLVGESRESIHHLQECYPRVLAAGLVSTCVLIASRIASFALDNGDMEEATTWAKCAGDQAAEDIDGRLPADYLSVRADLALLAGDLESARKFIGTMREHTPLYEAPRYRMTLLTYDQRLHAGDSRAVIDTELHSLLQWHQLAKTFGRHDDEMEALWVALNAHGEGALATELLSEYLSHHRRERRGPGYLLRRNTAGDPSWAQLLPKYLGTQTA